MAPFFGFKGKPKTPDELVAKIKSSIQLLASSNKDKEVEKAGKDATECIGMLAQCFPVAKGSTELGPDVDTTMAALLYSDETMVLMISNLAKLHFETRKAVVEIFQSFCKYQQPTSKEYPGLVYVRHRPYLMRMLVLGYDEPSIALNCGEMARFAISRDPDITNAVLKSEVLFSFFEHVQKHAFEVASDAFHTFKVLLVQHRDVTTAYLEIPENYDAFFSNFDGLLTSNNYATQRQLLMETFLGHESLMFKYIRSAKRLMCIMNLLRAKSRSIQFEAFHVFKVFVANPQKPDVIKGILISNREKLLRFLTQFLSERELDDETFAAEKKDIMQEIESLRADPAYQLRPSSSMGRHMSTSLSFSNLGPIQDDSSRLLDEAGISSHSERS